ncbi:hypothetical protein Vafri_16339 [Volvox africanus]|uniref:Uncharacterized protein n=1 Tax=Volvox africanus TaxID=51714 RepID=A0A8J4BJL7_9CHLO|nr:hypothetical protein Vafri_16339 [Volvox africanus]
MLLDRNIMLLIQLLRPQAFFHTRRRFAGVSESLTAARPPNLRSIEGQERNNISEVYDLYRIDDNANEFLMYTFMHRDQAEKMLASFESRGHKQIYFIRLRSPASKP